MSLISIAELWCAMNVFVTCDAVLQPEGNLFLHFLKYGGKKLILTTIHLTKTSQHPCYIIIIQYAVWQQVQSLFQNDSST